MDSTSASTSTKEESKENWDVFICFRGSDVRDTFLVDLEDALKVTGKIKVFVDKKLPTRDDISTLLNRIENSYIAIVIFSKTFADSSFCLDEIVRICERRRKTQKQIIAIPVFYEVDPRHVQDLQQRYYSERLRERKNGWFSSFRFFSERRPFEDNFLRLVAQQRHQEEEIKNWLEALTEISNIKGYDGQKGLASNNFKTEYQLIKAIAKDVYDKLCERLLAGSDNDRFVEINAHVNHVGNVKSLIDIDSRTDARTIGICGLRGVGKTTIAEKVYNDIKHNFDGYDFIQNIKENIRNQTKIRDNMIRKLLKIGAQIDIGTPDQIDPTIKARLKDSTVLILFNDVEDSDDLKRLGGERALYGEGSRIIVTSNDLQVLKNVCSENNIYEVKPLPYADALKLFCSYAFTQSVPKDGFMELSNEVISYAQGLPLALCVLGSNLVGRDDTDYWKSLLEKLKEIPDKKITKVLKTSYDGLERNERRIFLDIACLLKGERRSRVDRILQGCGFFPKIGMIRLIDKSLISISPTDRVQMHDLIQQMGQEIVQEECQERPGERSRLWKYKEACDVLENDRGTLKVEGMLIQTSYANHREQNIELSRTAFKKLSNLRIFIDDRGLLDENVNVPDDLEFLPEKLSYLYWHKFPLKYLPLDPKNLVELCLPKSSLTTLWDENKGLDKLRCIELGGSSNLTSIPSLENMPNLEILNLEGCSSLKEIALTPTTSSNLKILNCSNCGLKVLENLDSLPSLEELYLRERELESLSATITKCSKLEKLDLDGCGRLKYLPELPEGLKYLNIAWCEQLERLPELPRSLKLLNAPVCKSLKSASSSFLSLEDEGSVRIVNFTSCSNLRDVCRIIVDDIFARHLLQQSINLCIFGHEMPQGMMSICGSTLLIELDRNSSLSGLSLCAVLNNPIDRASFYLPSISCEANFKDEFGQSFQRVFSWGKELFSPDLQLVFEQNSFHILNWHEPFHEKICFIEGLFQFYLNSRDITNGDNFIFGDFSDSEIDVVSSGTWPIIKCGVHPIYKEK